MSPDRANEKKVPHANQNELPHTAVGGGCCRGSDRHCTGGPRRTDGRGQSPAGSGELHRLAGSQCQSPGNVQINDSPQGPIYPYDYGYYPYYGGYYGGYHGYHGGYGGGHSGGGGHR
jgi:hypothetical protein